ncbi:ATPase AAA-type core [Penicillium hispanicum]|uniref:ATPase AAA-type core n=1 Tax=Penicillium hispanicum TaxID=1080232 RepID=UPI00254017E6|nr:ATPase AAA-type core [Penicillium hispanicum]KAJ5587678.1 ATPase AAA-type core [Penicillium hispanicum]
MPADSHEEAMVIASEDLRYALHELTDIDLNVLSELDNPENMRELVTRIYHYRSLREDPTTAKSLDQQSRDLVISLIEFMETIFGQEYDEADALFSKGLVTRSHVPKLFTAQDLLVTTEQGQLCAYTLDSFPGDSLKLFCWAWGFDGQFWRHRIVLSVESPDTEDPIDITDLPVYPLKYATTDVQELLQSRGRQFWSLRNGGYVSYTPTGIRKDTQTNKPRYMVDVTTYQELHSSRNSHDSDREREYLSAEAMEADEPPDGNFLLLLPATIHGAIKWNKKAFDHLVLQSTKKELIRALVKKHNATSESTDVIEGKGNGLILLLHGGPGTGKTLTAESVAELTRRPLYRVTCGDVGTNAEEVEEYLESVLHLGKIWRCVVLLDEADVFLEERTQQDLKRNALVSVFLRVIEYYDGILVLTSNRIGTFDEAFKSRVQLIVHYPALQQDERRRVWSNFITGLQNSRVKARITELQERIGDLSQFELNGREIRNTIQTATLLAQFRKKRLCYEHLTDVIATSEEFKDYLRETRGHDESDYMRFKQIRRE